MKRYFPIGRLHENWPVMTELGFNLQLPLSAGSPGSVGGGGTNCRKRSPRQSHRCVVTLTRFFVGFAQSISLTSVLFFLCYFTFPIFSLPWDNFVLSPILSPVKIMMGNRCILPPNHLLSEGAEDCRTSMSTRTLSLFLNFKFCPLH